MFKIITAISAILLTINILTLDTKRVNALETTQISTPYSYWFHLDRSAQLETLYFGEPGNTQMSRIINIFPVKTGNPNSKPTPLPHLLGKQYFTITAEYEAFDPQTAPYFLELDIPVTETPPYGPVPYPECKGKCNWELPGAFGLHGIAGKPDRLSPTDPGSSGCIRHTDSVITYLYHLLSQQNEMTPYFISDPTVMPPASIWRPLP